jgi:hypothetical protein
MNKPILISVSGRCMQFAAWAGALAAPRMTCVACRDRRRADTRRLGAPIVLPCLILLVMLTRVHAADWPPISKEELAMTDDPANPGAAAILALQTEYRRIKVLNDEGKKYADIEIPYFDKAAQIVDIQARTVRPDGTAVNFQGQIFDRTAVKARKTKLQVKAFTLPEVQKGSILEYSYTARFRRKIPDVLKSPGNYEFTRTVAIPSADWLVQEDLFTRRARFAVHPFSHANLQWFLKNIPKKVQAPQTQADGTTVLEVESIPAFQAEEYMPPEEWMKGHVGFFYLPGPLVGPGYWRSIGTGRAKGSGAPASDFRGAWLNLSEFDRRKAVRGFFGRQATGVELRDVSVRGLGSPDEEPVLGYSFRIPRHATAAGGLLLLRPRILAEWGHDVMENGERKQPVEFPATTLRTETIEIAMPEGYTVDELPPPVQADMRTLSYSSKTEVDGKVLRYNRRLEIKDVLVSTEQLADLKKFYRQVAADEKARAVLKKQ